MSQEITIEVGDLHGNLHDQLGEALQEQYAEQLRNNVEGFIHDTYRQVERAQEQQLDGEEPELSGEDEESEGPLTVE